jgi:hypothetical protein
MVGTRPFEPKTGDRLRKFAVRGHENHADETKDHLPQLNVPKNTFPAVSLS